jgi:hypothetical protein
MHDQEVALPRGGDATSFLWEPYMNEKTLEATEAAQLVGLSRERLVRLVQRGEVEGERREGRWRVFVPSLEAWVRRAATGPARKEG